jgi:hypothetical protein
LAQEKKQPACRQAGRTCAEKELLKIHFVPLKENNSPRFKFDSGTQTDFLF